MQKWWQFLPDRNNLLSVTASKERGVNDLNDEKRSTLFDNQRFLGEIMDAINSDDKALALHSLNSYYYVSAYIWILKNDDKTYYLACPNENCKRKVIEESVGWRCSSCDQTYPSCVPTYMLSSKMADASDANFINFYKAEGTAIMGLPADKLKEIKD